MLPIASGISADDRLAGVIAAHLDRVVEAFDRQLRSDLPSLAELVRHIEAYRGKMLRPTLVGLCGMACGRSGPSEALTPAHAVLGAVVEMVHMATLVHDDVLDEADTRRRGLTVNRLRGNEAAVLLGDYLIASAFHLCSSLDDQRLALAVGHASMVMAAGELLQIDHRDDLSIDEPTYFEIVERKTAALIGVSCELGARASGASDDHVRRLGHFGRRLGIAFQIQDDLLDLTGDEAVVGKSVRKDLEKGKLTLPLIHHLASSRPDVRARSLVLLEEAGEGRTDAPSAIVALRAAIDATDSISYARQVARSLVAEAKQQLLELPDSTARQGLLAAADAVVNREL